MAAEPKQKKICDSHTARPHFQDSWPGLGLPIRWFDGARNPPNRWSCTARFRQACGRSAWAVRQMLTPLANNEMSLGTRIDCVATTLFHCSQDLIKRNRGERRGVVRYAVRNDGPPAMHEATARVNDIGHVAVALVYVWLDQWLRQAPDSLCRVVTIEQESANAVLSHWAHAVADYEPAGFGFDRRAAVA